VAAESATVPFPAGPPGLRELIDLHGAPVLVLDTATRLGTVYARSAIDRIFVVLGQGARCFVMRVDSVRDPEEIAPERLLAPDQLGGGSAGGMRGVLRAIASSERGPIPILDAGALVSGEAIDRLQQVVSRTGSG
jgi:chemotaxis signal transduction protein